MFRARVGVLAMALLGLFAGPGFAQSNKTAKASRPAAAAGGPQVYTSANLQVMTDLDKEGADELLKRLETMLRLVSGYFGKKNPRLIEMYVAKDIDSWPEDVLSKLEPQGIAKIRRREGVTLSLTLRTVSTGRPIEGKSVVYAYCDRGVPQHEAVHAYCAQAFGSTGPVW